MADELDLTRLAPTVDTERAGAAFRRRRRRSRSLRRGAWASAAVLVLVAGTVGMLANLDDDAPVVAGPGDATGPVTFDVLTVAQASDEMGTFRAATDEGEYVNLWKYANTGDPRPEIDFDQKVVMSITIPDDACPPELTAFDHAGDTITPVFVEPEGGCIEPLIPKTYVAALDWESVGDAFALRLPANEMFQFGEQRLAIDRRVSPPTSTVTSEPLAEDPQPRCADIESFAERITDTGITYDYEASASPEALFDSADVVLYGTLTGGFDDQDVVVGEDPTPWSFVGYEVQVDAVFKNPDAARLPGRLHIWLEYGPASVDSRAFEDVAIPGTPVVVFADASGTAPGYTAAIEGFATACPGEAPIGRVGGTDEWRSVTSLDGLIARLEAAASA